MADEGRQKDAMDVLQAWVDDYNGRAQPTIRLGSAGEAGGAQLRLKYSPAEGQVAILHMVAVNRDGRAAILVRRFEGPAAEAAVEAGLGASTQLGRRESRFTSWAQPGRRGSGEARLLHSRAGPHGRPRHVGWSDEHRT